MSDTKICRRCKTELPLDAFSKGYAICKKCFSKIDKESRHKAVKASALRELSNGYVNGFENLGELTERSVDLLKMSLVQAKEVYNVDDVVLYRLMLMLLEDLISQQMAKLIYNEKSYTIASAKKANRLHNSKVILNDEQQMLLNNILDDDEICEDIKDGVYDLVSTLISGDRLSIQGKSYSALKHVFKLIVYTL